MCCLHEVKAFFGRMGETGRSAAAEEAGRVMTRAMNKDRQDEALWLVHRLNALLVVDWRAQRWNVTLALVGIVLALFALAGLMIWAAWR